MPAIKGRPGTLVPKREVREGKLSWRKGTRRWPYCKPPAAPPMLDWNLGIRTPGKPSKTIFSQAVTSPLHEMFSMASQAPLNPRGGSGRHPRERLAVDDALPTTGALLLLCSLLAS